MRARIIVRLTSWFKSACVLLNFRVHVHSSAPLLCPTSSTVFNRRVVVSIFRRVCVCGCVRLLLSTNVVMLKRMLLAGKCSTKAKHEPSCAICGSIVVWHLGCMPSRHAFVVPVGVSQTLLPPHLAWAQGVPRAPRITKPARTVVKAYPVAAIKKAV
jgi:hypothetical protein